MKYLLLVLVLVLSSCASKQLVKISDCEEIAADIYRCPTLK